MRSTFPELTLYSPEWIIKLQKCVVDNSILTQDEFDTSVRMRNMIGHGSLRDFAAIHTNTLTINPDRTLEEMIVHIASAMV